MSSPQREAGRAALRRATGAILVLAALALPTAVVAHVVYGSPSLFQLLSDADLVVRVNVVEGPRRPPSSDAKPSRPLTTARILDVYRGEAPEKTLQFAQHGHGVAPYEPGDEAIVFLRRIERSRELDELAASGEAAWVSLQEHDDAFKLTPESREAVVAAVRDYLHVLEETDPAHRMNALRALTIAQLRSPDLRLQQSAVRDLVVSGDTLVTAELAPELIGIVDDPSLLIGVRMAVLTSLEQQGLVETPTRWAELLRNTPPPDRMAVVRAASAHPSLAVTKELLAILAGADLELAAAAAISLGVPGNEAAVAPLAKALGSDEQRLRMAAIRGLGGIATDDALATLEQAAESHPDPATRRRARGEVARLADDQ